MKKLLCIVLILCLSAVMIAGCGDTTEPAAGDEPAAAADDSAAADDASAGEDVQSISGTDEGFEDVSEGKYEGVDAPTFKIGMSYYTFTDSLGSMFKKVLEYTAEQFNCEIMLQDWTTADLEGAMEAHENMIEAGCDGIITVLLTPGMLEAAENAGIPVVQACNIIEDSEMMSMAQASDFYVAGISEDEPQAGYDMAQGLYDSGARKWAYCAPVPGMATSHDNRVRGIEKFVEEHDDVELIIGIREEFSTMADSFRQAVVAYPEIDGICITGNDGSIIGAIYADGLQDQIKVSTIDIQEGTDEYLEDGTLAWIAGGQYPTMQLAFTILYNKLTGNDLVEDNTDFLLRNYMYITSAEEYAEYTKFMEGSIPAYSGDELKDLCVAYNPDATLDMLKAYNEAYSLEDVVTRHADLY